jgi:hypothetical protein
VPFPLLGAGVVDFEEPHAFHGAAEGGGIHSGAQDHHLASAIGDGGGHGVVGELATGGNEHPPPPHERWIEATVEIAVRRVGLTDDCPCVRVGENTWLVGRLMVGPGPRHRHRGTTGPAHVHGQPS